MDSDDNPTDYINHTVVLLQKRNNAHFGSGL
jgi:hypothetical protein